jgi:cytoskeletal protein CcmA (bactofilin family)
MAKSEDPKGAESGAVEFPARACRLGAGLSVQAEITGREDLVLQGPFKGLVALTGAGLYIDARAEVEAEVEAAEVIVHGALTGNIRAAGRVVLAASARVKGNITAAQITIEDGAMFRGAICMKPKGD